MPRIFSSLTSFTKLRKALRSKISRSQIQKGSPADKTLQPASGQTSPPTQSDKHDSGTIPTLKEVEQSTIISMESLEQFSNVSIRSFDSIADNATRTHDINFTDKVPNPSTRNLLPDLPVEENQKRVGSLILRDAGEEQDKFGDVWEDDEAHCGKCGGYWWEDNSRYKTYWGERPPAKQVVEGEQERYKCNRCGHYRIRARKVVVEEPAELEPTKIEVLPTGAVNIQEYGSMELMNTIPGELDVAFLRSRRIESRKSSREEKGETASFQGSGLM
jgi:hypothetical protein